MHDRRENDRHSDYRGQKKKFWGHFQLTLRDADSKALTRERIADRTAANNGTERASN